MLAGLGRVTICAVQCSFVVRKLFDSPYFSAVLLRRNTGLCTATGAIILGRTQCGLNASTTGEGGAAAEQALGNVFNAQALIHR